MFAFVLFYSACLDHVCRPTTYCIAKTTSSDFTWWWNSYYNKTRHYAECGGGI